MPLTPGTRLGPYRITAQIGVGGMGEVYRATDTKLDRDVAIKILQECVLCEMLTELTLMIEPPSPCFSIASRAWQLRK